MLFLKEKSLWIRRERTPYFFDPIKTQSVTRIPCYAIFDARILKRPICSRGMKIGWYNRYSNYEWNSDNRVEIEKGWFIKGDAIQKFASKLDIISDTMQKTISSHNLYCDAVIDSEFGIKKTSLAKIHQPPYVALKLYPVIYTQGGPKRNALCQVVDPFDNAIPILYSAGELRSFWGWMYNGDGNVSECLVTGRIAGANAASLSSC